MGFENEHIGHIQTPVEASDGDVGLMSGVADLGVDTADLLPGEDVKLFAVAEVVVGGLISSVIFGEDFKNPACTPQNHLSLSFQRSNKCEMKGTNIVLNPINILKLNRNRELPRILIINIASPMRRQVRATILVIRDFIFPLSQTD